MFTSECFEKLKQATGLIAACAVYSRGLAIAPLVSAIADEIMFLEAEYTGKWQLCLLECWPVDPCPARTINGFANGAVTLSCGRDAISSHLANPSREKVILGLFAGLATCHPSSYPRALESALKHVQEARARFGKELTLSRA